LSLLLASACRVQPQEPPPPHRGSDVSLAPDTEVIQGQVPPGATLATLFRANRLREDLIPGFVQVASGVFDPRHLQANHPYRLVRTLDGLLRAFEYEIDGDRFLRMVGESDRRPDRVAAEIVPYTKEHALVAMRGEIDEDSSSLFAAMETAGETPELSMALADIFAGEIDFNSDLQPGDDFDLVVEKVFRDGRFAGYGPIEAAQFDNDGRRLFAIRFTPPGGKPGYYDEEGRSLRRFFLRSPLRFVPQVTSRFTRSRLHPILRIVRPHLGVDYGAPVGAPVVAVASGVVVSAGDNGEGGRVVHLRHASGYETYYMHLSAIAKAIHPGVHVSQGELVGRVGMSGLATGPHLDYRIKRNSVFVNPLAEHKRLPPGDPIPAAYLAEFRSERDRLLTRLYGAEAPGAGTATK